MKTIRTWIIIVSMLVFLGGKASAYCLMGSGCPQSGTGWPVDTATFHSNGFSSSNSTFDSAFVDALNIWNGLSDFSYSSINGSVDPCGGPDGTRGWKAAPDMCGASFQPSTLAVAIVWLSGSTNEIIDADIIFNNTKTWDVHSGSGSDFDFKRVAAHELGHTLGLDHDNTSPALMNTTYSQTIETPQTDDINGLCALYGGSACASPAPDIKANGTDGTVTVTPTDNLSVTVALAPGNRSGDDADWWVAADTPLGWYYFDLSTFGFVYAGASALNILVTLQGTLLDLPTSEILNIPVSVLPSGTYTFYLAVDMNMNGILDFVDLFFDSVVVNITP